MREVEVEEFDDEELEAIWDDQEESVEVELEIVEPEPEPEVQEDVPDWVPPSLHEIVDQVVAGNWGKGQERRTRLEAAGYDHVAVQKELVRRMNHR